VVGQEPPQPAPPPQISLISVDFESAGLERLMIEIAKRAGKELC